jgi:deazaflavin-dependent oxidoreductase (nitroreductase family)
MPILELTTIGRKSGQPRAVLLSSPLEVNGNRVIVASRGGDDTHPAWFLNLRDNPKVEVVLKGGPKSAMHAHIATADERAEMWPKIASKYKNYRGYQAKTSREIPLVVLTPAT